MQGDVSIWRWAVTDDLGSLFARLVAASDAEFAQIATEVEAGSETPMPSIDEMEAQAEAKFRAMDVPPDVLDSMLKGLKTMMQESREEAAADDQEAMEGYPAIALASSHMFSDAPFAALTYEAREAQVAERLEAYRTAASAAIGQPGQSLSDYLGVAVETDDDALDVLLESELAAVVWLWEAGPQVYFLSEWQEDKELPIDLEFGRAPSAMFAAVRAQIRGPHEM